MSLRYGILGLLAERAAHGYDVKTRYEDLLGGTREINIGQIYTTLQRLERDGLIAFELARSLRREGRELPLQLFVSGHLAPQVPQRHPPIHGLPYAQFVQELRRYRGTPEAVLANQELLELLVPVLRADFQLFETYVYQPDEPLDCPISAFGGLSDVEVSQEDLAAWRRQTKGLFTFRMLPGNHFFIQSARAQLLQALSLDLLRHVSAVRPAAA